MTIDNCARVHLLLELTCEPNLTVQESILSVELANRILESDLLLPLLVTGIHVALDTTKRDPENHHDEASEKEGQTESAPLKLAH